MYHNQDIGRYVNSKSYIQNTTINSYPHEYINNKYELEAYTQIKTFKTYIIKGHWSWVHWCTNK